jgi:hypothetical protein
MNMKILTNLAEIERRTRKNETLKDELRSPDSFSCDFGSKEF